MDDGDNGQLLDMDSSDQQTSQIDSEMESQQSSSQEYRPPNELSIHNKKRQSTESNSSSVVGKYWRSKSLPVAYLPPLGGQDKDQNNSAGGSQNTPSSTANNENNNDGSAQQKNRCKDQQPSNKESLKRGSSCRNCGGGSTRHKNVCGGGRCCRGSAASANSHNTVNNGKVKGLGGGSCAEQVRLSFKNYRPTCHK